MFAARPFMAHLKQTDFGSRGAAVATAFILTGIFYLWEKAAGFHITILVVLADFLVGFGIGLALQAFLIRLASRMVGNVFADSGLPQAPDYSREDALIIRGKYREAAESFEKHLLAHPEDHDARLRLAQLHEQQLGDALAAEEIYLAIRRREPPPTAQQEVLVANSLIDLYRRTNQRGRLMKELARFADRYRGSPAAEAAANEVKALKALRI